MCIIAILFICEDYHCIVPLPVNLQKSLTLPRMQYVFGYSRDLPWSQSKLNRIQLPLSRYIRQGVKLLNGKRAIARENDHSPS